MASKKDKDAENGLQILGIMGIVWTIGFFYLSRDGDFLGIGLGQFSIACCGTINLLLTVIFLASWRYTVRENRVKDYLNEHFTSHDSVSLKQLIDKFKLSPSAAYKSLGVWIIESKTKGTYDTKTGIFAREPVEPVSSGIIDIEFHDVPDDEPEELSSFCPNCGEKLTLDADSGEPWCEKCKKHI